MPGAVNINRPWTKCGRAALRSANWISYTGAISTRCWKISDSREWGRRLGGDSIFLGVGRPRGRRECLVWDAIPGPEIARYYKPKPVVYLASAAALDCEPGQVMMVAAHSSDLAAAAAVGV